MKMPFEFDIEMQTFEDLSKAGEGRERRIGGIVSTSHLDRHQEVLLQEGLDFKPFLKGGWFNDNHKDEPDALVGYPEIAELRTLSDGQRGWYVEGYLLKGTKRADQIWETANALTKTDRRLGFSVEGAIQERDPNNPKLVRKAVVREVAITRCPVNTHTQLEVLAKSLSVGGAPQTPEGASILGREALEGIGSPAPKDRKRKGKRMKKSEAVALLVKCGATPQFAERVVEFAQRWHPAA